MKPLPLILLLLVLVLICLVKNSWQAGCAWSGCGYNRGCITGVTKGEGRTNEIERKKCSMGWLTQSKQSLCCDPNCRYRECGFNCGDLGVQDPGLSQRPPNQCTFEGNGKNYRGNQYFCCDN